MPVFSFPGSARKCNAGQALPADSVLVVHRYSRQSLDGSAFPGRAWERERNEGRSGLPRRSLECGELVAAFGGNGRDTVSPVRNANRLLRPSTDRCRKSAAAPIQKL